MVLLWWAIRESFPENTSCTIVASNTSSNIDNEGEVGVIVPETEEVSNDLTFQITVAKNAPSNFPTSITFNSSINYKIYDEGTLVTNGNCTGTTCEFVVEREKKVTCSITNSYFTKAEGTVASVDETNSSVSVAMSPKTSTYTVASPWYYKNDKNKELSDSYLGWWKRFWCKQINSSAIYAYKVDMKLTSFDKYLVNSDYADFYIGYYASTSSTKLASETLMPFKTNSTKTYTLNTAVQSRYMGIYCMVNNSLASFKATVTVYAYVS